MKEQVIVVCGPTATGKTALGIELARRLGGEIVSADSMQVYRRMDIGTAKATAAERAQVPHHMIDVCEPWEDYSVSRYVQEASRVCDSLLAAGKIPVIVGGTGLYIDSLLSGRTFAGGAVDPALRQELNERYDEIGAEGLLGELRKVDPERAEKLHPADKKRIVRALEVYILTGKTITQHDRETQAVPPRYDAVRLALDFENRADLYARIDRRVDLMLQRGLTDEVRALLDSGVPRTCTAMQAIGYKEIVRALDGACTLAEAAEDIRRESRRYAKRQLTWLRRGGYHWLRFQETPDLDAARRDSTAFLALHGVE